MKHTLSIAAATSLALLGGCTTFKAEDGHSRTVLGIDWSNPPSTSPSWLTSNVGEVLVAMTTAAMGTHVVMTRRRGRASDGALDRRSAVSIAKGTRDTPEPSKRKGDPSKATQ